MQKMEKTGIWDFWVRGRLTHFSPNHFFWFFKKVIKISDESFSNTRIHCEVMSKNHVVQKVTSELKNSAQKQKLEWACSKVLKKCHFLDTPKITFCSKMGHLWTGLLGSLNGHMPKRGSKKWPKMDPLEGVLEGVKNGTFWVLFKTWKATQMSHFVTLESIGRWLKMTQKWQKRYDNHKMVIFRPQNGQKWPKKGHFWPLFFNPLFSEIGLESGV